MLIQDKATWDADIDKRLALMSTLGIDCVSLELPDTPRGNPLMDLSTLDSATAFFKQAKAKIAEYKMDLRTVLATSGFAEIKRGTPGRDEKIAHLQTVLRAMGAAGIPIMAYNFKLLLSKILRSAPTLGRGGASYISFDYEAYLKNPAPALDMPISEAQVWSNMEYFLKAVIPVAEQLELFEVKWAETVPDQIAGFKEMDKLLGPENVISRTVITPDAGPPRTFPGRGFTVRSCIDPRGDYIPYEAKLLAAERGAPRPK